MEKSYDYDSFGAPVGVSPNGDQLFGYSGKPYDRDTGLYDYGYRDYRPGSGRFTTVDPVKDGSNWYGSSSFLLGMAAYAHQKDNPDTTWDGDDPMDGYYIRMGIELHNKDENCED